MRYNNATGEYDGLNDSDRALYVKTTSWGWHRKWKRSGLGITTFVRANRSDIDAQYLPLLNRAISTPNTYHF